VKKGTLNNEIRDGYRTGLKNVMNISIFDKSRRNVFQNTEIKILEQNANSDHFWKTLKTFNDKIDETNHAIAKILLLYKESAPGGYSANFWVGVCRWDSETLTLN